MDISEIVLAAIGGGLGAGAGVLAGRVFFGKQEQGKTGLAGIVTIALVVLGARMGAPVLDPHIGPSIRDWVGVDIDAEIDNALGDQPFLVALEEHAPERFAEMRSAIADGYRDGGSAEAQRVAAVVGSEAGAWIVTEFGSRASDEALIAFYASMSALARDQLMEFPEACYGFFFPAVPGGPGSPNFESLGVDAAAMTNAMIDLMATASDEPLPFDTEASVQVQTAAATAALASMGEENADLFGRRAPVDQAEYTLACTGMVEFLDHYLASENGIHGFRQMSASN
jgi:hypothetical protein